jgi:hypothetical protein
MYDSHAVSNFDGHRRGLDCRLGNANVEDSADLEPSSNQSISHFVKSNPENDIVLSGGERDT